jgi:ATP-dependent RNA helicase RhlE
MLQTRGHQRSLNWLRRKARPSPCRLTERNLLTSFSDFGLADPISLALTEENYVTPTPIQAQTIPLAMSGRDVVGIAQTGTGKTAAFALPILHRLIHPRKQTAPKSCRVLVLSPTRELSGQILDSFNAYGRHLRLSTTLAIGGVPMGRQVRAVMPGVDVMVATPGRLLDLVRGNALKLNQVEILVLDEADRMLDMGFINDIRKIVAKIPTERQTLFFSATMPKAIAELADDMLRDPARVAVTPVATTAERVSQRIIQVDRGAKPGLLAKILKGEPVDRALVFTRTKHGADKVVKGLAKANIAAQAIHGNKSQNHRERTLAEFRSGKIRTLVATDIAARGIDVDGISHVVNFDIPNIPETYVHRIGRTARAGADGVAISLVDADEVAYLRDIEKLIRQNLPREDQRTGDQKSHAERTGDTRNHQARSNDGRRQQQPRSHRQDGRGKPHRDGGERESLAPPQPQRSQPHRSQSGHLNGARTPDQPAGANDQRGRNGSHQPAARQAAGNGSHESIQGVAFMARESRPARPSEQRKGHKSGSNWHGRPRDARQPQR